MTSQNSSNSRSIDSLVRLLYSQRLMAHRRALLIGGDYTLAEFIAESGARHVTAVLEQPPTRPWPEGEKASDVELQIMPFGDLRFRDGAFDIAVVPDLAKLADPNVALNEVRRVVGASGHVVVTSPNPTCGLRLGQRMETSPMDYYEMYNLLASMFPSVQMVGQSPFVGYAVADLAFDDPELQVSFDTSLLGGETEEIECFLAVCGEREAEIEPYSIIQIPLADAPIGKASEEELDVARIEIKSLNEEIGQSLAQNKSIKEQMEQAKLELGNRGVRIASLEKDLETEIKQSEAARARAVQLAKDLDDERRAGQKKKIEEEYGRRTADMELQTKVREVSTEMRQAQERARSAETARDQLVSRMRDDAAEIDDLRQRTESLEKENESLKNSTVREREILEQENARLEAGLKEKAGVVSEIQAEIKQRESIIRDLVVELDSREGACSDLLGKLGQQEIEMAALNGARAGQHRARVEAELALAALEMEVRRISSETGSTAGGDLEQAQNRIAKLEGELQAARWRIAEVEARSQVEPDTERLQVRIRELETNLGSLERGSRMMEEESERYKTRALGLEGDLEKARTRSEELQNEVSAAAGRRTRLENDLAGLSERFGEAEKRLDEAQRQVKDAEGRAREAEARLQANVVELKGARERIAYVSKDTKAIETELRREIAGELEQANQMSSRVAQLEDQLKQARSRIEEEIGRNNGLTRALEMLRAELTEESDRTRKAGADAARLAGEKGDLEHRISRLEQELADRISELASNEQVIVSLREELSHLTGKVRQMRVARAEDKEKMEPLVEKTAELGEARRRAQGVERKLLEANETKEKIEAQLKSLQSALKAAQDENSELRAKANLSANAAQGSGKAARDEKHKEHEALLESLTAQLEEREQRASRLERQIRELINQIREHESDVVAWDMELKFRNSRISQLEEENFKLQESLLALSKNN
jgi:chromosome segregation ATPase